MKQITRFINIKIKLICIAEGERLCSSRALFSSSPYASTIIREFRKITLPLRSLACLTHSFVFTQYLTTFNLVYGQNPPSPYRLVSKVGNRYRNIDVRILCQNINKEINVANRVSQLGMMVSCYISRNMNS